MHGGQFADLRNYVSSRLLWNPGLNGEKLISEFINLYYGRAAPSIQRFINLIHDNAEAKGIDRDCYGRRLDFGIDDSIIKKGFVIFDEAMRLAENEIIRNRVEEASICVYSAVVDDVYKWACVDNNSGKIIPPEMASRTRPIVRKFFELCGKYGVTSFTESKGVK